MRGQIGEPRSRISPQRCALCQLNYSLSVHYVPTHNLAPRIRLGVGGIRQWLVRSWASIASFTLFGLVEQRLGTLASVGSGVCGSSIANCNFLNTMWLPTVTSPCAYNSPLVPLHQPNDTQRTFSSHSKTRFIPSLPKERQSQRNQLCIPEFFISVAESPPWGKPLPSVLVSSCPLEVSSVFTLQRHTSICE